MTVAWRTKNKSAIKRSLLYHPNPECPQLRRSKRVLKTTKEAMVANGRRKCGWCLGEHPKTHAKKKDEWGKYDMRRLGPISKVTN